jgi:hypothetical protein
MKFMKIYFLTYQNFIFVLFPKILCLLVILKYVRILHIWAVEKNKMPLVTLGLPYILHI